jgi:NAD(P)-dependent dehydrogenase (short-subunit alcohol dehydrogenase family)
VRRQVSSPLTHYSAPRHPQQPHPSPLLTTPPGIGRATSFSLAKNGITFLTLTDINFPSLLATTAEIKALYPTVQIESIQLDVCDEKAVNSAIEKTVEKFGRIDVAVNIAGIGGAGKNTHESEDTDWLKTIEVNLNGVWRCQRAEIRAMLGQE